MNHNYQNILQNGFIEIGERFPSIPSLAYFQKLGFQHKVSTNSIAVFRIADYEWACFLRPDFTVNVNAAGLLKVAA